MNFFYNKILSGMLNKLFLSLFASAFLLSCTTDPNSPGVEYMPDMYRPEPYEAYLQKYDIDSVEFYERNFERIGVEFDKLSENEQKEVKKEVDALFAVFVNGTATKKHPKGAISKGHMPFLVPENNRDSAKSVQLPLEYTEQNIKEGEVYYNLFCDHCHGEKGDGNGPMVELGVYPVQPPAYNNGPSAELTPGEIYHTIHYGKGVMGSHAAQISAEKRWKIVMYVQTLQGKSYEELAGIEVVEEEADAQDNAEE